MRQGYRPGDPPKICDRCGLRYWSSEMRSDGRWPALQVCDACYDPPHPQEEVTINQYKYLVDKPRPEQDPVYITEEITADDL